MISKRCIVCGKEILIKRWHAEQGWGKYCSKKCQSKAQVNGRWVFCNNCGKKIYRTPKDFKRSQSGKFFCCVSCHCIWENKHHRSGENAPNWITGRTAYRALMKRSGVEQKCGTCGIDDKRVLVVHHRNLNRKNNKPDNLVWLCRNCHCLAHLK